MTRTPPADVRRALRAEVNFGCPVPGCGVPFLTWHHFDPPWSVREHHELAGMIALCRNHASAADGGTYSKAELRVMKQRPYVTDVLSAVWPWQPENLTFILGGSILFGSEAALTIGGIPVVSAVRSVEDRSGVAYVGLGGDMKDKNGDTFLLMDDNI